MDTSLSAEIPDHDTLSRLAREDPIAYENWRREMIEDFIASAPDHLKRRLRGVQFRIDCTRQLSPSALGKTVRIYDMMWQSFVEMNQQLHALATHDTDDECKFAAPSGQQHDALLYQFPPRASHG